MATVFKPQPDPLTRAGFSSVAHIPVIFDTQHRYLREHNRYLRERALLEWPEDTGHLMRRVYGRRVNYLRPQTLLAYAHALANWIEWCEATGLDWRDATYVEHALRYRDEMLLGKWSADGTGLKTSTAESRVDRVVEFLIWAAERGLRSEFKVLRGKAVQQRGTGSGVATASVSMRIGRRRPDPRELRLPSKDELSRWSEEVAARRGYAKALACKTILAVALRKNELVHLNADFIPENPEDWRITGTALNVKITEGTKGGKGRIVSVPLWLATEIDRYRRGKRVAATAKWTKLHRGEKRPKQLFLSEFNGNPLTAGKLYEAWTCWVPYIGWSPHLGRHTWACYTLLSAIEREARKQSVSATSLPHAWVEAAAESLIRTEISPQLGHIDAETSLIYLRWLRFHLNASDLYASWHNFLSD